MNSNQFLSKSGFAAAQGWSPSYVSKLSSQGRLIMSPDAKLIDVDATLALLNKTRDPGKAHVTRMHADGRTDRNVRALIRPHAPAEDATTGPATDSGNDPGYWDNKSRRENAMAQLAELELAERQGSLVSRARVESAAYAAGRTLRDALLGLPTRLAPEVAVMTDAFEIETKLKAALRTVLDDMAKMSMDDLNVALSRQH